MTRRMILTVAVLLLAAAAGAAWWYDLPARWNASATAETLTLYGNVDIRQVQLGFRVGGRLDAVLVEEGARVQAGDVLARLDTQPLDAAARGAEAQVAAQRAMLAKLEAGPREAELAQARAFHAEAVADLQNARQVFERADQLRMTGSVSQAVFDQARSARDMAAARATSAQEALQLLEEGARAEDIAAARANLQAALAELSAAETSLDDAQLRAPSAGIVLSRVREPGSIVGPGEIVAVLSLTQPISVRAYVAEPDLGRIHPGMEVEIVTDTAPAHPYSGTIGFISPVAEFTPRAVETPELRTALVYRLRITVTEADEGLRQGMPVTVRVADTEATR